MSWGKTVPLTQRAEDEGLAPGGVQGGELRCLSQALCFPSGSGRPREEAQR